MNPAIHAMHTRWSRLAPNVRGALWLVLAGLVLIAGNVIVKLLGARVPTAELLVFRGIFGTLTLLPIVLWHGWRCVATSHPWMHLMRTCVGTTSMFGVFYSITHMQLADATAILFSSPLFATIFAAIILHEVVGWRRGVATAIGFIGILVMMRPGGEGFEPVALVAVGSALLIGALAVIIRRLAGKDSPNVIVFWFTCGSGLLALPFAVPVWVTPVAAEWPFLVLIGILGLVGQAAFTFAFSVGESSAVAPFDYLRLVFAAIAGYLIFAEVPDAWSIAGAAVIMGSTFYIVRREARLARARRAAVGPA